jgi:signal transduction histidine kinase
LSNEEASTIFRIVQEVFTNIARHSDADTVQVNLTENDGHIIFNIKDNGVGFRQDKHSPKISFGILGMKERAISIGAEFHIVSSPGNGTEILLILKT